MVYNISMVYKVFEKMSKGSGANNKIEQNERSDEEWHRKEESVLHLKTIFVCWFNWYATNKQV